MNKEQKRFWNVLSKKYPKRENRSCWNCAYIRIPEGGYPCNNCHGRDDKDLSKWEWSGELVKYSEPFPWEIIDD